MQSLRQYCSDLMYDMLALAGLPAPAKESQIEGILENLAKDFWNAYRKNGMPYGPTEEDLVRYLWDYGYIQFSEENT